MRRLRWMLDRHPRVQGVLWGLLFLACAAAIVVFHWYAVRMLALSILSELGFR